MLNIKTTHVDTWFKKGLIHPISKCRELKDHTFSIDCQMRDSRSISGLKKDGKRKYSKNPCYKFKLIDRGYEITDLRSKAYGFQTVQHVTIED